MIETAYIDACFFKNFAAGDGLAIFDQLFPDGASTGIIAYRELCVFHADVLPGRLNVKDSDSSMLLTAIGEIQFRHRALSTADAELFYLAETNGGTIYTDEQPLYKVCQARNVSCRRFIGYLHEAVNTGVLSPVDAIAFLQRVLVIKPPRRFPPDLITQTMEAWQRLKS